MKYLKRFLISIMLLDNLIMQGLKKFFPTRHKIAGTCRQCGVCCQEIHLKMTPRQIYSKFFRDLCIRWLSFLYDFYLLRIDYPRNYLVFSCKHKGKDGKCQNYFWRPAICRNYPLLDYFEKPVFLKGCGYEVAKRET